MYLVTFHQLFIISLPNKSQLQMNRFHRCTNSTYSVIRYCLLNMSGRCSHVNNHLTNHLSGHEHEADSAGGDKLPSCQTSCVTFSPWHRVDLLAEPLRLPQTVHAGAIVTELRVRVFVFWRLYPERTHCEQVSDSFLKCIKANKFLYVLVIYKSKNNDKPCKWLQMSLNQMLFLWIRW